MHPCFTSLLLKMRGLRHHIYAFSTKTRPCWFPHDSRPIHNSGNSSTTATNSTPGTAGPSPEEITEIGILLPRLCRSNHLQHAIRLTEAAMIATSPSPSTFESLSIPSLIEHLAAQPDMVDSMALLNRLKHNPHTHSFILPFNHMLINAYFKNQKPKGALKIFQWMMRSDSPSSSNKAVFNDVVSGLCGSFMVLEGLKILRQMMITSGGDCLPGLEVRASVYRALLREARIREAKDLNEALGCICGGDDDNCWKGDSAEKILKVLNQIVSHWEE